jgi:hypothetical protein
MFAPGRPLHQAAPVSPDPTQKCNTRQILLANGKPRNPNRRRRLSTVDLLVLTSWDQLICILKKYIYILNKTS